MKNVASRMEWWCWFVPCTIVEVVGVVIMITHGKYLMGGIMIAVSYLARFNVSIRRLRDGGYEKWVLGFLWGSQLVPGMGIVSVVLEILMMGVWGRWEGNDASNCVREDQGRTEPLAITCG